MLHKKLHIPISLSLDEVTGYELNNEIISKIKNEFKFPTFAYQVSGEYSMIKAAGERGWIDEDAAIIEQLTSFKRAGADAILTYFAPYIAKTLNSSK